MDFDDESPPPSVLGGASPCPCSCLCCGSSSSPFASWSRSLKRKLERIEEDLSRRDFGFQSDVARVEIENEAAALRETLGSHQQSIQELHSELEEERNASATAASEAMSMILRLQREKAEAQMEFRQFKRFAEEKMSHDQEEIAALEDLLFKREQAIQSLSCEIQAYKHRLMSYGFGPTLSEPQTPDTATAAAAAAFEYPPLRCNIPSNLDSDDTAADDLEKYAFGETPREQIQNLEQRILQLERIPSTVHEKGVVGFSPHQPRHTRRVSVDSYGSSSFALKGEEFPTVVDRTSECGGGRDDTSMTDRVCTVDAVHGASESYVSTPREFGAVNNQKDLGGGEVGADGEEEEIKGLYTRLQALEADRESMRQTIISMGTDKAQLVLLREIAQQLCKEGAPLQKKIVKKPSFIRSFSIFSAIKWITSFVFWRKKSPRTRYAFGLSSNNAGLLLLLDKSPRMRQRRFLTRTLR